MNEEKTKSFSDYFLIIFCAICLFLLLYFTNPFRHLISTTSVSTSILNEAQRNNIIIALNKINSLIIKPNEEFSFNKILGPRISKQGYKLATSYLASESPQTVGGGICLLSSVLYKVALQSNLQILERHAHLKTVHSVPPGLDATVWYGKYDLKFKNTLSKPIKLKAKIDKNQLTIAIYGQNNIPNAHIERLVKKINSKKVRVEVFLVSNSDRKLVSRDLYELSL